MRAVLTVKINVPETWEDAVLRAKSNPDGLSGTEVTDLVEDGEGELVEIEILD